MDSSIRLNVCKNIKFYGREVYITSENIEEWWRFISTDISNAPLNDYKWIQIDNELTNSIHLLRADDEHKNNDFAKIYDVIDECIEILQTQILSDYYFMKISYYIGYLSAAYEDNPTSTFKRVYDDILKSYDLDMPESYLVKK